jgi:hypothetical protein
MAGVLFIVCVPTSQHEVYLTENSLRKGLSSSTISEHFIRQFPDNKSGSLPSLRKNISTTKENLCATDDTCISYVSRTPKSYSIPTINIDDNPERSNLNEAQTNKRGNRAYDVEVKPDGSRRIEDFTKKGVAGMDSQTGQTMPMAKVRRNTVTIVYLHCTR